MSSSYFFLTTIFVAVATAQAFKDYEIASLEAHNMYRSLHRNTPPMKLDNDLNRRAQMCAQHYARKGRIDHSCPYKNGAGENLSWRSGGKISTAKAAQLAVQSFYNEKSKYNYNNPGFSLKTGHFTQVVWASSTRLGVGVFQQNGQTYVVNLYFRHGNVNSHSAFRMNVNGPR